MSDTCRATTRRPRLPPSRARRSKPAAGCSPATGASSSAAGSVEALPPMRGVEIAFAGRSNVGKSSLINALTGRQRAGAHLAHAGPHPGADLLRRPTRR